jgi:toxin ParE1/3/4
MRLVIDDSALVDIEQAAAWVAKDSPQSAHALIAKIFLAIDGIERLPGIGHEGRARGTFERGVSGTRYVIVYEVSERPICILVTAVFHTARRE